MTKEEFVGEIQRLLNEASVELTPEEYRDACDTVCADCEERIGALDDDSEVENEEDNEIEEED